MATEEEAGEEQADTDKQREDGTGMNTPKDSTRQKIRYIANHYGYAEQSQMCIEECAELIQSISKFRRAKKNGDLLEMAQARKEMLGEVADD